MAAFDPKPETDSDAAAEAAAETARLEAGRLLFAGECSFVTGVAREDQLPESDLQEVAFAGRSNVGKSSLLNALTGRKALARTSNTPGRTRELNYFDLAGRLVLVDLPGYGYAKVSKRDVSAWTKLIRRYLAGRVQLARVCLLVDARHGAKANDREIMKLLDKAAVSYQVVLTKADKLPPAPLAGVCADLESSLRKHPAAFPQVIATSAVSGAGLAELRADLASFAVSD